MLLEVLAFGLLRAESAVSDDLELAEQPKFAATLGHYLRYLEGYLRAMADASSELTRRGASSRKELGAKTRDRVRSAVQPHRGRMTRDDASYLVAGEIGKAPSSVRRLLSELFPGDTWVDALCDTSTDTPRPDH
jgi:hypothetical protein